MERTVCVIVCRMESSTLSMCVVLLSLWASYTLSG